MFPYYKNGILFIPQLFYKEILLPFGIQSTQIHINEWNETSFKNFESFINKNSKKIINLDYVIDLVNPNIIQTFINYIVEKTLKTIRLFK